MELFAILRFVFLILISFFLLRTLQILNNNLDVAPEDEPERQAVIKILTGVENVASEGRDTFPIGDELTLGRDPRNSLLVTDAFASGFHLRILKTGINQYTLEDLNSSNGTFLNGVQVEKTSTLKEGDHIRVGRTEFVFKLLPMN